MVCSACGTGLLPNKAPQVTHVNGTQLQMPIRGYGQLPGAFVTPGQTLIFQFEINEPSSPGYDVYWPEPLPGWHWEAETLTATWTVPDVIVDYDLSTSMLIVDRDKTDPRFTQVYIPLEQLYDEDEFVDE